MAIKITFTLQISKDNYEDIVSNIKRNDGLELKEDVNKKGDIICTSEISDENSERTANLCAYMINLKGVKTMQVFVTEVPDKEQKKIIRMLPFFPMIVSSGVTFLIIYSVLGALGKDTDVVEIFKLAGVPTIVVFLSQLGYATQELWYKFLRRKN